MTVYADILFLVNFSMDFLTLYLTSRILSRPSGKLRLSISSVIGAAFATIFTLIQVNSNLITTGTGLILTFIMTRIAFGKYRSKMRLVRDSVIVWGAGVLLGGLMTSLLSLGDPVYIDYGQDFSPVFLACVLISLTVVRLFSSARSKKSVSVSIKAEGMTVIITGLCDSGNAAREPFSSLPVIIVSIKALDNIGSLLLCDDTPLKLRFVPVDGIGGHTVMRGFIPDEVVIDNHSVSAVIAADIKHRDFSGYDAVVPDVLCRK
ncbi:MAG: hypothetical protein E7672_06330 [Ruminococcaceae bacterium]|nr:hypothetical protein [Oscillospiraceae bacterium]